MSKSDSERHLKLSSAGSSSSRTRASFSTPREDVERRTASVFTDDRSRYTRRSIDQSDDARSDTISIISEFLSPPLRYLAGGYDTDSYLEGKRQRLSNLPTVHEQRHPGKEGAQISKSTRQFEPDGQQDGVDYLGRIRRAQDEVVGDSSKEAATILPPQAIENDFLSGWPLALLLTGICLAIFLISTDRTIITTAIPYITREFRSTEDIGWYGSAYLLTSCAFQPLFGRVYLHFNNRWSYLVSLFFFEIGSLICGVAHNSVTLIIGRAIAGFGCAGILTGSFVVIASAIPLHMRPIYTAAVGIIFGVGATVGPLLGGIFTDLVTWRWCFYINLPVGGVTMLAFLFFYKPRKQERHSVRLLDRIYELDVVGNVILLGATVMLFLALEFTSQGEAWSSARVVGLLCGFGVTTVLFIAWQWWKQDGALIPPAIVCQRTVAAACIMSVMIYGSLLILTYFLPIWFQAVLGTNAIQSGVNMIPYFIVNAFFSMAAGVLVSVIGYYAPFCLIGNAIAVVGCGLQTMVSPNTSTAEWAGYQIVIAAGFGLSIQQGFIAVQTVLPPEEISIGTAAVVASQSLGGALFLSVANSIFQNQLFAAATEDGKLGGVDVHQLISAGATAFRGIVAPEALPGVVEAYNNALQKVFITTIPLSALAFVASFAYEWKSVKVKRKDGP
ncbi:MFS-type efflux pump MFS1 [Paramyrothecium foliicola]|nr:MFS-type efflux pump MFS1 [Paramyrothecium foliicola]